jgi:hypothetical protein
MVHVNLRRFTREQTLNHRETPKLAIAIVKLFSKPLDKPEYIGEKNCLHLKAVV